MKKVGVALIVVLIGVLVVVWLYNTSVQFSPRDGLDFGNEEPDQDLSASKGGEIIVPPAGSPLTLTDPAFVEGHRGGFEFWENSMEGYSASIANGINIEGDIRKTADGVYVLMHNPNYQGNSIASSNWYNHLENLNLPNGEQITRLDWLLDNFLTSANPDTSLTLEVKTETDAGLLARYLVDTTPPVGEPHANWVAMGLFDQFFPQVSLSEAAQMHAVDDRFRFAYYTGGSSASAYNSAVDAVGHPTYNFVKFQTIYANADWSDDPEFEGIVFVPGQRDLTTAQLDDLVLNYSLVDGVWCDFPIAMNEYYEETY
jgi:hypothetical protein